MEKKKEWKKKEIAAARLASILATRWTGNLIFFYGQPDKPKNKDTGGKAGPFI